MKQRETIDALRAVLAEAGIHESTIEHGGKHPRLVWEQNGRTRFLVFSSSPSDNQHSLNNSIRQLRQKLGIRRETNKNPANRERRDSRKVESVEAPTVTPGKDWTAPLAEHPLITGDTT